MRLGKHPHERGSVVLVALCCVAVSGIALASYLAFSAQAMKLSNRSLLKSTSARFAEMGLEEALRALSAKTFTAWTAGTGPDQTIFEWAATGSTARCKIYLPSTKFGASDTSATVNVQIDYCNAAPWEPNKSYNATDNMVWFRGIWFQANPAGAPNTGRQPPNPSYWTSAPTNWNPISNYNDKDIALVDGMAYRCKRAHINHAPPNSSYWEAGISVGRWSISTSYTVDQVVIFGGTPYRCVAPNSGQPPPNTTFWVSTPVIHSEGRAKLLDNALSAITTQLVAAVSPASLFPNAAAASQKLSFGAGGVVDSYNSALIKDWSAGTYYSDEVVRDAGTGSLYRCTANLPVEPPSDTATHWIKSPLGDSAVLAGNPVSIISTTIYGYVAAASFSTSPYDPNKTFGTSPAAKLKSTSPSSPDVDLARISRSPYIPLIDFVSLSANDTLEAAGQGTGKFLNQVADLGSPTSNGPKIYEITNTYLSGSSGTYLPGLNLWTTSHRLRINGPVILKVSGSVRIKQGNLILSNDPTTSLTIVFSNDLKINEGAVVDNQTLKPEKLGFFGTTSSLTSYLDRATADAPLYCVVYLPYGKLTLGPDATRNPNIYGAFSAMNLTVSNSPNLHYDTSLRTATFSGIDSPFVITNWRELTDAVDRITFP